MRALNYESGLFIYPAIFLINGILSPQKVITFYRNGILTDRVVIPISEKLPLIIWKINLSNENYLDE
jgi:hypothetical protein